MTRVRPSARRNKSCPQWALAGQCGENPGFMYVECPHSCDVCKEEVWRYRIRGFGTEVEEVPRAVETIVTIVASWARLALGVRLESLRNLLGIAAAVMLHGTDVQLTTPTRTRTPYPCMILVGRSAGPARRSTTRAPTLTRPSAPSGTARASASTTLSL